MKPQNENKDINGASLSLKRNGKASESTRQIKYTRKKKDLITRYILGRVFSMYYTIYHIG
jgi:hypothetical protein